MTNLSPDPLRAFFWVAWLVVVLIAVMPLAFFLLYGWPARRTEFLARVESGRNSMKTYYRLFWPQTDEALNAIKSDLKIEPKNDGLSENQRKSLENRLFKARYNQLVGRWRYVEAGCLFAAVVALLSGLVVITALRTGYDTYVSYLENVAIADASAKGLQIGHPVEINRLAVGVLDQDLLPFPPLHLSLPALAAVAGAYLFVVAQLIQESRARSLVYSDLYNYSLRLAISVPLGLSVMSVANTAVGSLISFGLGAFPTVTLGRLLRRLTSKRLEDDGGEANVEQTLNMVGVTRQVSDVLADENITCAQQIACIDPVVLAVRTGLSFDYVLSLGAQSIVWSYLGPTTPDLGKFGLFDARAIAWLVQRETKENRDAVYAVLKENLKLGAALEHAFNRICDNAYTQFLVEFEPKAKHRDHTRPDENATHPVVAAAHEIETADRVRHADNQGAAFDPALETSAANAA